MYSGGWAAPATQSVASAATGGITAPLPSNTASAAPDCLDERQRGGDVGVEGRAGHAAAAAAAADGRHAREDRVLEAVRRRVAAAREAAQQVGGVERVAPRHDLRFGRPAASHGDDHHAALVRRSARRARRAR